MPSVASNTSVDVSLVVIAYNEHDHVAGCIRAILAQETEARFEVIFVDDGSVDGTADAVTIAGGGDERLQLVVLRHNSGRGAARAAGVAVARGPVIGFVDADITLPVYWLARCLAALPGNAAVGGIPVPDGDVAVLAHLSGAKPRGVAGGMPVTGSNVLFDADVLREFPFDPHDRIGEDFRLASRLLRAGHRLRRVPGLIVQHRENKSYKAALAWRYANGLDAATHPRELGILRLPDFVWAAWFASCLIGLVLAAALNVWWILLGVGATIAAGVLHANSRFRTQPFVPFLRACVANIPLMAAYLIGRTAGLPRLVGWRRSAPDAL
jgi:glycosyltransferase involved in cell wall biosynthesis